MDGCVWSLAGCRTLCLPTFEVFKSSLEEFVETNRQQLLESIVKTDNMAPNPRLHTWWAGSGLHPPDLQTHCAFVCAGRLVLTRDKFVESLTKLPWNHSDHPVGRERTKKGWMSGVWPGVWFQMPESELTLLGCPYESLALRLQAKVRTHRTYDVKAVFCSVLCTTPVYVFADTS